VVAFGSTRHQTNARWNELIGPHLDGAYLSFDTEQGGEQVEAAFPPATLARLREIKGRVDPENLFRDNANVLTVH
ncbi:MAG TPA: BBE domain-containing protein, partial [Agromyces sp.]